MRFIHTADWHLGKGDAEVADEDKRVALRRERFEAVRRIGGLAREHGAEFVLVGGDLFHSTTPSNNTVAAALEAVGSIPVPVIAIPGNHDHGGPGSVWHQEFFQQERRRLAPNLDLRLEAAPVSMGNAVILPCPLVRKQESGDVTAWLHAPEVLEGLPPAAARIVLAHGSVHGFSSASDEDDGRGQTNAIDLERMRPEAFDYIALGDWHGTKEFPPRAWYAGTPELDRFLKGGEHDPGNVLLVNLPGRGAAATVTRLRTAGIGWHRLEHNLGGENSLDDFWRRATEETGSRVNRDLLHLTLGGHVSLLEDKRLEEMLATLEARLLRLKLAGRPLVRPSDEEIARLAEREDNLIAGVAKTLRAELEGDRAEVARLALRELYLAVNECETNA